MTTTFLRIALFVALIATATSVSLAQAPATVEPTTLPPQTEFATPIAATPPVTSPTVEAAPTGAPPTPPAEALPAAPMDVSAESAEIRRGEIAFEKDCTQCHDAAKSFEKSRSQTDWMATIRRMAQKADASIPTEDFAPIAAYLAARNPPAVNPPLLGLPMLPAPITLNGTLSPTWRGGNSELQNGGFFPDVWLGVNVDNGSPLTGRATACIACHDDGTGSGSRVELVDAALHLDLLRAMGWEHPTIRNSVEAGRFIVPFGAFAAQSNPGVYRTVTRPLIYNMGMRVREGDLGDPVLPMPYSDEGAVYSLGLPVTSGINLNLDGYVVNGLQGTADGVDFDMSRSYTASNTSPSLGGRATLGNEMLRFGVSALDGTFSPTGGAGPAGAKLGYHLLGADAVFRYRDMFRLQFEYAQRNSDHLVGNFATPINAPDMVDGGYLEGEVLLTDFLKSSFLMRYDWQRHSMQVPAFAGLNFPSFDVQRITTGLNFTLRGGSLLMLNYEYWLLPSTFDNVGVYGVRWAASF